MALAQATAQLTNGFDNVAHPKHVGLGEQTTVGIHGKFTSQFDPTALHEGAALAALTKAGFLELLEHFEGEAVVDHRKVRVRGRQPRFPKRFRGRNREPGLENISAIGDLVGGIGLATGRSQNAHGAGGQISCALGARHHHCGAAIGFQAAIEEAVGVGQHGRSQVVVHRHGLAVHDRLGVQLRVLAHGERNGAELFAPGSELVHMPARHHGIPLGRRGKPKGEVIVPGDGAPWNRGNILGNRLPHPGTRIAVPARGQQDIIRHPAVHGGGGGLEGRGGSRAPHVDSGRIAEIFAAEIGGDLLRPPQVREGHDAIDFRSLEPRLADGPGRCLELYAELAQSRTGLTTIIGLPDSNDAGFLHGDGRSPLKPACSVQSSRAGPSWFPKSPCACPR